MLRDWLAKYEQYPYVILENWDAIAHNETTTLHILVHNKAEIVQALELSPKSADPDTRVKFKKKLGLKNHDIIIRTWRDDYFPTEYALRLLKGRIKDEESGLYIPHKIDRFWSILYKATYHKEFYTADEIQKFIKWVPDSFPTGKVDRKTAHDWLCGQGIFPVKCKDPEVGYFIP